MSDKTIEALRQASNLTNAARQDLVDKQFVKADIKLNTVGNYIAAAQSALLASRERNEKLVKDLGKMASIVLQSILDDCKREPWMLEALRPGLEQLAALLERKE